MKISIYAPYAKERFEIARQHSILHPERIVGNSHFGISSCLPGAYQTEDFVPNSSTPCDKGADPGPVGWRGLRTLG
jgi:hypothetical protein